MRPTKLEQLKQRFNEISKKADVSQPADKFILGLELEKLKDQIKQELEELEDKPVTKCQKPKSKKSVE